MQGDYGVVNVSATLEGDICADGELMFYFVSLPNEKIKQSREELYGIVTKNMKVIAE